MALVDIMIRHWSDVDLNDLKVPNSDIALKRMKVIKLSFAILQCQCFSSQQ